MFSKSQNIAMFRVLLSSVIELGFGQDTVQLSIKLRGGSSVPPQVEHDQRRFQVAIGRT